MALTISSNARLVGRDVYKRQIENSKQPFAYAINKKGNIVKQKKSSYDAKKKAIKFTTSRLSKVLTGY